MFDYDANIRVNINDTAALAALKKLEDKIAQLSDPRTAGSLKSLVASSKAQLKAEQDFSALKQERAEDLAYRKRKTRQITDELRLNNAIELQEGRRIKLQRAGALDVASRKKAIAKLDKIAAANPKNAQIQERVATGLGRILSTQNELNRATNKNIGQKQRIADYNKQIERLRELGATEGQLKNILKRRYEFTDAAERRQTTLADRRELQLKRGLKLLKEEFDAKRAAATAVTRPGTLSGGARSVIEKDAPKRSVLDTPETDKARFEFYQKEYKKALAEVNKTEKAYRNQLSKSIQNNIDAEEKAKLASINRVADYEQAQNKRNNRLEKEEFGLKEAAKKGKAPEINELTRKSKEAAAKVQKAEAAYEKQLNTTIQNNIKAEEAAKLASINRVAEYERAQNKRTLQIERENFKLEEAVKKSVDKSAKAGGPSSPLRQQSVLGSDESLRKKAEYYERVSKAVKPLSSPMRPQSILGSDDAIRAKAKYLEDTTKKAKAAGIAIRKTATGFNALINKAKKVEKKINAQKLLPDTKRLGAEARGIKRIETSAERTQRFAERRAQALKRSEERSKGILEANEAAVKAGKANAAAEDKAAKAAAKRKRSAKEINRSALSTKRATKETATNLEKATKGGKKGEGFLNFGKGQTNLAAGVGFPLLFGGGPGSVIGGGLGALAGGFGGSIIGGAIGTQLDKLGAAALSTAEAFEKLGSGASDLIPKLGRGAGEGFGGQAQFLIDEGSSSQVGEILRKRFAEVYGDKALADFDKLAEANKKFKQTWQELGVQFQLLIDGPLKGLLGIINRINFNAKKDEELTPQELKVRKLEQRNRSFASTITPAERAEYEAALAELAESQKAKVDPTNTGGTADTEAQKQLVDLVNQKKEIEKTINTEKLAALEQALTARRDDLALLNTAAGITRATADLDNTRKELAAERNAINKDTLKIAQLEKTEVEQAAELERQRVAQANALRKAQLQIYKDEENARISAFRVREDIYQLELKKASLITTAANQAENSLTAARQEASAQEQILRAKFELRKLDIKENEVKIEEAILLETKVDKIKAELALKEKQIEQAEVLRRIGIDQYNQQQELNTLLAEQNALRAQQASNPSRTLGFDAQGFGFFGDSFKLEADLVQKYNDDIDVFNRKIADAKANLAKLTEEDIKDGRAQPFLERLDTLEVLKGNYERLQPAINAAALEQQRFNDALAVVSPGVNALVGGLKDVVTGTKSAEEAFADFLNTIGEQLIQTAAVLIAQYIAIGIARAFAMGSSPSPKGTLPGTNFFEARAPGLATGGTAEGGQPYIVGEKGPELFIPGVTGTVTNNDQFEAARDALATGNGFTAEEEETVEKLGTTQQPSQLSEILRDSRSAIESISRISKERETAGVNKLVKELGATSGGNGETVSTFGSSTTNNLKERLGGDSTVEKIIAAAQQTAQAEAVSAARDALTQSGDEQNTDSSELKTSRDYIEKVANNLGSAGTNTVNNVSSSSTFGESRSTVDRITAINQTRQMLESVSSVNKERSVERAMENTASGGIKPIDVRYESQVINNVEYVTAEQHRAGVSQAAERGRALALQALQNSVQTRKRVGL